MSHKKFRVTANLPPDVGEVLRIKAGQAGRSMSSYVERLIHDDLAVEEGPPMTAILKSIPASDAGEKKSSGDSKPYPTPPAARKSSGKKRAPKH